MAQRDYFAVELVDTSGPAETTMKYNEADGPMELATIVKAMDTLDMLKPETELRVNKMRNLDEPLTEEEEQELEEFVEEVEMWVEEFDESLLEDSEEEEDLPKEGDVLYDPESNYKFGDGRVEVVEVAHDTADGYFVTGEKTVADMNPEHPSDDPVILARYAEGSDKCYSFPLSRLEETA